MATENWNKEEWGGWKIVSDMLDNPDENGIYRTSECYEKLYEFVCNQKQKAIASAAEAREREISERVKKAKRYDPWEYGFNVDMTNGYNRALDEVLSIINPSKE